MSSERFGNKRGECRVDFIGGLSRDRSQRFLVTLLAEPFAELQLQRRDAPRVRGSSREIVQFIRITFRVVQFPARVMFDGRDEFRRRRVCLGAIDPRRIHVAVTAGKRSVFVGRFGDSEFTKNAYVTVDDFCGSAATF